MIWQRRMACGRPAVLDIVTQPRLVSDNVHSGRKTRLCSAGAHKRIADNVEKQNTYPPNLRAIAKESQEPRSARGRVWRRANRRLKTQPLTRMVASRIRGANLHFQQRCSAMYIRTHVCQLRNNAEKAKSRSERRPADLQISKDLDEE